MVVVLPMFAESVALISGSRNFRIYQSRLDPAGGPTSSKKKGQTNWFLQKRVKKNCRPKPYQEIALFRTTWETHRIPAHPGDGAIFPLFSRSFSVQNYQFSVGQFRQAQSDSRGG